MIGKDTAESTSSIIQEFNTMNSQSSNLHHRSTSTATLTTTTTENSSSSQNALPRKRLFPKPNSSTTKAKRSLSFFIFCFCAFILIVAMISLPTFLALDSKSALSITATNKLNLQSCSFRTYKENRYYKVDATNKENFLANAEYIRGQFPFILNPKSQFAQDPLLEPKKLCLDTSTWEYVQPNYWPFSDGQNPSIISLASNVYNLSKTTKTNNYKDRIDSKHLQPLKDIYDNGNNVKHSNGHLEDLYLGLLLFGDSQCRWNLSKDELEEKKFSPLDKAPQKRSMVVIFDSEMNAINSSVLNLVLDADWGGGRKKRKLKMMKHSDGSYGKRIVELDDARIFFYNRQLHVLYRNGPYFGYDHQVQNPIHFEKTGKDTFEAYIKASESFKVCCGRNIAFISEVPTPVDHGVEVHELHALTWIDPVTTEVVKSTTSTSSRRLSEKGQKRVQKLMEKRDEKKGSKGKKKSHIHGTNGYMLPLHSSSELFGIAHFHRPEGRQQNDYARHGHHYTHAFFTLQYSSTRGDYFLKRLSNEFIFMAPSSSDENTGDVIQFTSGLDLIGSDRDGKLMISYGINDCEAATFFLSMERVQELLIDVNEGDEVVDLMKKVIS